MTFEHHCVKSVRIRGFPGPHFPAFGNSEYGHFLRSARHHRNLNLSQLILKLPWSKNVQYSA